MERWKLVATIGAVGIVVLWGFTPLVLSVVAPLLGSNVTNLGAAGDIFGAVSALFNGLAFLAIIVVLVYDMASVVRIWPK